MSLAKLTLNLLCGGNRERREGEDDDGSSEAESEFGESETKVRFWGRTGTYTVDDNLTHVDYSVLDLPACLQLQNLLQKNNMERSKGVENLL